ncbi:GNAT family N-acetyltransferase [Pseudomonas gingeri NCPPB 3146 = LMG 5327]|uniref:GNAT family N-acetyltransferase n=2 Tax=Pseudomonas gingeri TaxID=117681 RepID=A0A7Y7XVB5_9PSED|nr:GNAT family N-acetyltransferase [Pseudomonas gingeri]NWC12954.1 GNAT family N-acetyltransferase [Pseudomonas gingeri]PNQ90609.1 GNAT family N-acetyltransferase [Pseudomonas gingeri NCPPB 3146 = LMG 5327]
MTALRIRSASAADCDSLSHIAGRTFALACPASTPAQAIARHIEEQLQPVHFHQLLQQPGKILLVLELDGQLIGYSLLTPEPGPVGVDVADGAQEFTRCYVVPEQHGSGAAGFLMSESLKLLSGPVRLSVSEENPRAIRFYERHGFRIVGRTTFQCGNDVQRDWLMLRS